MGIKDFGKFIKENLSDLKTTKSISELKGKRIAIDGTFYMHKIQAQEIECLLASMEDPLGTEIDEEVLVSAITRRILRQELSFLENGFETYWIFDGKSPEDKKQTQATRAKARVASKTKFENELEEFQSETQKEDEDTVESILASINKTDKRQGLIKKRAQNTQIPRSAMEIVRSRLKSLGVPVMIARGEGEHHGASMCFSGLADYVYTTDTDVLASGASVLKEFSTSTVEVFEIKEVLDKLRLSQESFRDFCILLGCDFNKKLKGVNPLNTYLKIKRGGSIENIPGAVEQKDLNFERCRELLSPYQIEDEELPDFDSDRLDRIKDYVYGSQLKL